MSAASSTLDDGEVATVIDALAHYRDTLRAEGKTGANADSALNKITRLVTPSTYFLTVSAPEVIVWEPFGILAHEGHDVRARFADGRLIVVSFLGDTWSWRLLDHHGEEIMSNWVDTKAEAQQAALVWAAR